MQSHNGGKFILKLQPLFFVLTHFTSAEGSANVRIVGLNIVKMIYQNNTTNILNQKFSIMVEIYISISTKLIINQHASFTSKIKRNLHFYVFTWTLNWNITNNEESSAGSMMQTFCVIVIFSHMNPIHVFITVNVQQTAMKLCNGQLLLFILT